MMMMIEEQHVLMVTRLLYYITKNCVGKIAYLADNSSSVFSKSGRSQGTALLDNAQ